MPKVKNKLGQYFTPSHVAEFMVDHFITKNKTATILEPSSGEGVFLNVLKNKGYNNVVGVEVDPDLAGLNPNVVNESFVTWQPGDLKISTIIGNPPYIRWKDLDEENKTDLQQSEYWGDKLNYLTDFLNLFIIKSVDLLEENGELVFITPKFWMNTASSQQMRDWMLDQGYFESIVDFGEATVFPGVASHIIIFKFVKSSEPFAPSVNFYNIKSRQAVKNNLSFESFQLTKLPTFRKHHIWTYLPEEELVKLEKFEKACTVPNNSKRAYLGDYVDCANGLVSGLDAAFLLNNEQLDNLNEAEKAYVIFVPKAKNMELYLTEKVLPYFLIPVGEIPDNETFEKSFPTFAEKLQPLKEQLLKRHSYSGNLQYWEWAFLRSFNFHFNQKPKIMVPVKERLTSKEYVRFSLTPPDTVATQDVFALTMKDDVKESLEYCVAFLTLPIITEWVKAKGLMKGGIAEFGAGNVKKMPFRPVNWENPKEVHIHTKITDLVKQKKPLHEIHSLLAELLT